MKRATCYPTAGMSPGRIVSAIVLVWSAFSLALAAVIFVNLGRIESPERYLALLLGLAMLYMGGSMLVALIFPAQPKEHHDAPIEIPPLDQVRGRTSYREDIWPGFVMFAIGASFLAASLDSARHQPVVLVISAVSVGVLAGAVVMIFRQFQYGRARLELDRPARRGDSMRGVITTSGFGWTVAGRKIHPTVELVAFRTYRSNRRSTSITVARSPAIASVTRDGKTITIRFTTTVPIIDTSEGRFSWNVQVETRDPKYEATFLVDVG